MAYAAVLSALPQVRVVSICDRSARALTAARRRLAVDSAYVRAESLLADPDVDAVVAAVPPPDCEAIVRGAVQAGKPVLVSGVGGFAAGEPGWPADLAARGGRVAFVAPLVTGEGFRLLRAQAGPHVLERRYLRVHRSEPASGAAAPLALLTEEALALWRLLGALPEQASATAAGDDTDGGQALFATFRYRGGLLAVIDITTMEPGPARRVTLVGEGRTVVLDEHRPGSPITVCHLREGRPALQPYPPGLDTGADPVEQACRRFVAFLRGELPRPDVTLQDVAAAISIREAVRRSARLNGRPVPLEEEPTGAPAPALRLIKGRGRGSGPGSRSARLRLISR